MYWTISFVSYEYGNEGAALATVLGSSLTVVILCTHFFTKKEPAEIYIKRISSFLLQKIIANGFTSFVIEAASGFTIFIFNLQLIRYLGNTGVSVYGIICNTALVVICLCKGIEQAAQPILSINHGAGFKPDLKGTVTFIKNICDHLYPASPSGIVCSESVYLYFSGTNERNPDSGSSGHPDLFYRIFVSGHQHGLYLLFSVRGKIRPVPFTLLLRGCILVVAFVYILPVFFGSTGIWLAFPAAEFLTMIVGICFYRQDLKAY